MSHKLLKLLLIITGLVFTLQVEAKREGELTQGMVNPGYHEQPSWFKNSFLDINEDITEAGEAGKRLMIFFYQDGCPYCQKLLEDNFGQREITEKTRKNFDVVTLNIWGDREVTAGDVTVTEKQFAEKLKVMYTPTLMFFNEQGNAVLRTNGYYHPEKFNATLDYVLQHRDQHETFRAYLDRVSPAPAKGVIHREVESVTAPYKFNQLNTAKHLLVMFEQKQCSSCDELHQDILSRSESRELLQTLEVAVLDMWSDDKIITPDGQSIKTREWAKQLNVQYAPSLVYFSPQGKEVFRSEAYLKAFHIQSIMDYVSSGAYKNNPNFQRYIEDRAERLRAAGIDVDIMK